MAETAPSNGPIDWLMCLRTADADADRAVSAICEWIREDLRHEASTVLQSHVDPAVTASDAVQDAFVLKFRGWLREAREENEQQFRAYLRTCMRRFSINLLRRHQRETRGRENTAVENEPDSHADHHARRERTKQIDHAISLADRLPPDLRAVYLLKEAHGWNHRMIGEYLQITNDTSRARLHQAKLKLNEMIAKNE